MHLTRLFSATILHRKVWFIWLLLGVLVPAAFPYLTPWEEDRTIVEPARAQAAWQMLWLAAMTWGLFQGAGFGEALSRQGLGEYLASQGTGKSSQLGQTWLACLLWKLPMLAAAVGICLFWASPADPVESKAWFWLNLQYAALFLMVFAALLLLAIGLASRIGQAGGFFLAFGLAAYGLVGVKFLATFFDSEKGVLLETVWTFSPHYHLADLTERLIFKSGNLPAGDFGNISLYLAALLAVHLAVSWFCFTPRRP